MNFDDTSLVFYDKLSIIILENQYGDISTLVKERREIQLSLKFEQHQRSKTVNENIALRNEVSSLEKALQVRNKLLEETKLDISQSFQGQIFDLENKNKSNEATIEKLTCELQSLKNKRSKPEEITSEVFLKLENENKCLRQKLKNNKQKNTVEILQTENSNLKEKYDKLIDVSNDKQQIISNLRENEAKLHKNLKTQVEESYMLSTRLTKQNEKIAKQQELANGLKTKVDKLTRNLRNEKEKVNFLFKKCQHIHEISSHYENLKLKCSRYKSQVHSLSKKYDARKLEVNQLKEIIGQLKKHLERFKSKGKNCRTTAEQCILPIDLKQQFQLNPQKNEKQVNNFVELKFPKLSNTNRECSPRELMTSSPPSPLQNNGQNSDSIPNKNKDSTLIDGSEKDIVTRDTTKNKERSDSVEAKNRLGDETDKVKESSKKENFKDKPVKEISQEPGNYSELTDYNVVTHHSDEENKESGNYSHKYEKPRNYDECKEPGNYSNEYKEPGIYSDEHKEPGNYTDDEFEASSNADSRSEKEKSTISSIHETPQGPSIAESIRLDNDDVSLPFDNDDVSIQDGVSLEESIADLPSGRSLKEVLETGNSIADEMEEPVLEIKPDDPASFEPGAESHFINPEAHCEKKSTDTFKELDDKNPIIKSASSHNDVCADYGADNDDIIDEIELTNNVHLSLPEFHNDESTQKELGFKRPTVKLTTENKESERKPQKENWPQFQREMEKLIVEREHDQTITKTNNLDGASQLELSTGEGEKVVKKSKKKTKKKTLKAADIFGDAPKERKKKTSAGVGAPKMGASQVAFGDAPLLSSSPVTKKKSAKKQKKNSFQNDVDSLFDSLF